MNTVKLNIPVYSSRVFYSSSLATTPIALFTTLSVGAGTIPFASGIQLDPKGYAVLSPRGTALRFTSANANTGLQLTITGYNVRGQLQSETVAFSSPTLTNFTDYVRIVSIVANQSYTLLSCVAGYPLVLNGTENYAPVVLNGYEGKISMEADVNLPAPITIFIEGADSLGARQIQLGTLSAGGQVITSPSYATINRVLTFGATTSILLTLSVLPILSTNWVNLNAQNPDFQARVQVFPAGTITYQIFYTYSPTYRGDGVPVNSDILPVFQPQANYVNVAGEEVIPPQVTGVKIRVVTAGTNGTLTALIIQQGVN